MGQVQCLNPRCGSYRIDEYVYVFDSSGKGIGQSDIDGLHENGIIRVVLGVVLIPFGLGIPILIWGIVSLSKGGAYKRLWEAEPRTHSYKCQICGYSWTWREDQPIPTPEQAHPGERSELLHMGAQRLEEEEEERRRRAYGAYLQDQERKRQSGS